MLSAMEQTKKKGSKNQLFVKLANYCAYQERCVKDLELQLQKYELSDNQKSEIIGDLVAQKYIDELRYAKSIARGKFNFKSWGKIKISIYLRQKGIDQIYIKKALDEISVADYDQKCLKLVEKELDRLSAKNLDNYVLKQKLIQAILRKGFDYEVINRNLKIKLEV
jgi:regulatory protein